MASCARESGVAQVIINYYRNVYKEITFDFLLFWDVKDSFKEEILSYGGNVSFTGAPSISTIVDYCKYVDDFFSKYANEYDAVHLHELYLSPIIFYFAKKHGLCVRIAHSHTTKLSEHKGKAIRNKVLFLGTRILATHFFACSKLAGIAAFGESRINKENFYVIKNAINCEKFFYSSSQRKRIREEFFIGNSLVIGNIGRFSVQKNQLYLIDIFVELLKKGIDAKLMLVGNGPLFDKVVTKVKQYNIYDKVILTGVQKDIGSFLSAMDIFVFPSIFEGLGNVLIEAQCNGLKCIAADTIPNEARISPSYQSLSIKEKPIYWANMIINNNIEREAEVLGYVNASGYDITVAANELIEIYNTLVK